MKPLLPHTGHRKAATLMALAALTCAFNTSHAQPAADFPYLAGIHWYDNDPANGDVEAMTGGRGVWTKIRDRN